MKSFGFFVACKHLLNHFDAYDHGLSFWIFGSFLPFNRLNENFGYSRHQFKADCSLDFVRARDSAELFSYPATLAAYLSPLPKSTARWAIAKRMAAKYFPGGRRIVSWNLVAKAVRDMPAS